MDPLGPPNVKNWVGPGGPRKKNENRVWAPPSIIWYHKDIHSLKNPSL